MIQSMTGYGKSVLQLPTKKVTIEIKSLNSKNLDLNVRIPSYYKEKELAVRKRLASALVRGKVDFSIFIEMTADETSTTINHGVVNQYIQQLRNVVQTGNSDDVALLRMAIAMPDALKTERAELDENEWNLINKNIEEAIKEIVQYRIDEAAFADPRGTGDAPVDAWSEPSRTLPAHALLLGLGLTGLAAKGRRRNRS